MSSRQLDEEAVFHVARQIASAEARAMYLDQVCAGDKALQDRVEALLAVHEQQSFLKSANGPATTVDQPPLSERPGTTIGRYRLMEQVGEGGMGVVFVAEQEKPLRRKVALKVIKPGMDSKAVIARFEAERQALALMDHPNIAKVLDAGSTESGRPFFVMELVRGIPIVEYCDAKKLTIRERLDLFIQVCQAIQHAHQKGIIHRDIKPTNVLVTEQDGKAVPKVIDFGVAKALGQRLTERTIYTSFQGVVGTPLYMSPEQAALSAVDVDTRSDVYSLGVLLYELLTGTTPLDKKQLEQAACEEAWRMVREHEPPKPSTKVSTLGQTAASVSECRQTVPERLTQSLRGDLDWIVMKALEKDRSRRYETASGFAGDVKNYLDNQPVAACPPSVFYRLRKLYRRNRVAMVTSGLVLASLIVGIVATAWMAHRANRTLLRLADAAFEQAVSAALSGDQEKANAALVVAQEAGIPRTRVLVLQGLIAVNDGRNDEAIELARQALTDESFSQARDAVGVRSLLAVANVTAGYDDLGELELLKLRELTPVSDTDHLLMANAFVSYDFSTTKGILDKAPGARCSPAGLALRSWTNLLMAVDSQDAVLMEDALKDYEHTQFLFRDSQGSLCGRMLTLACAIQLARAEKRDRDVARYTADGRPLAAQLAAVGNYPGGDWSRWEFCLAIGDPEGATRAIRNVGRHPGTYSWFLSAHCLQRHGDAAVEEFDKAVDPRYTPSKYVRLARAHLVRPLPDGAQQVRELVADMADDASASPLLRRHALLALCLANNREEIEELAKKTASATSGTVTAPSIWEHEACLDYLAGRLTEPKLLERAKPHGYARCCAYFTLAMARLAAGKRGEAKECFQNAVATNAIGTFDHSWCRAYLARMDADPTWPKWLQSPGTKPNPPARTEAAAPSSPSVKTVEGKISVPGGKVWYRVVGSGKGTPLLLLHGGPGGTCDAFQPLEALADERPIILYDQLGCGKSDRPNDVKLWRVERFVEELAEVRRSLGLESVCLYGHSWGTMLAVDYLLTKPRGVQCLVLSSPCLSMPRWIEDQNRYRAALPKKVQEILGRHEKAGTTDSKEYEDASVEYYRRHLCRMEPFPEILTKSLAGMGWPVYHTMWGPSEFCVTGNLKDYDRTDRLREIPVPTLFSCGRYDEATPEATKYYQSMLPGSEMVVFEKSAHTTFLEETAEYLKMLRGFLRRVDRASAAEAGAR